MHMYKTTESPLLGVNKGAGSLERSFLCGCPTIAYIIRISIDFALGF